MTTWPNGIRIHMLGIGGSGMSSLALYLKEMGALVSGSDPNGASTLSELKERGIDLLPCGALPGEADLIVHSAAVVAGDPQLNYAHERGMETLKYSRMLGRIMDRYTGVAVAGTHGKTSVSALLSWILQMAGKSPSFVIGGHAADLNGGGGAGDGEYFIAEGCEYDRSFLNLNPQWALVTNLEPDHLDYYGSFTHLTEAFEYFIEGVACRGGNLVVCDETLDLLNPYRYSGLKVWTYGFSENADLVIRDLDHAAGRPVFRLVLDGRDLGLFGTNHPGRHSALNAAGASLAAMKMGVEADKVREALPRFQGVRRRLEQRGVFGGVRVFSDYAHHPTEVRAVLDALRNSYPQSRLVVAYQGHQCWRTGFFMDDFGTVLAGFDLTLILKTFSVREKHTEQSRDGEELADRVKRCGGRSHYIGNLEEAPSAITPHLRDGDLLVLMGAGTVDEISGVVTKKLSIHR